MSVRILLIDVLWLIVLVPATVVLPRIWRGQPTVLDAVPGWWAWGKRLWFGVRRIIPLSVVLGWIGLAITLFPALGRSPDALTDPELVLGMGATVIVLLVCLLMTTVVVFNRPSFAVPPRWRSEPGALQNWLRHRRGSRASR